MNIFESLYNCYEKNTIAPFEKQEKYANFIKGVKPYCKQTRRNPKEEFLTQVFTHIMLNTDKDFRKAFLEKIGIANSSLEKFDAEYSVEYKDVGKTIKGEIDVFGTAEDILMIIENKLGSEISLDQPEKYKTICKQYKQKHKYIVILTKFSGLISYWNSHEGDIKEKIVSALEDRIGEGYICKHIYWHEVYTLLENNFSDTEMQQELLAFLKGQNLDQSWYQDMGCPFWRKDFNDAYKAFAQKHNLPQPGNINKTTWMQKDKKGKKEPVVKPHLGKIKLSGTGDYFAGARIQGARAAELSGNCSMLQLVINGKAYDIPFDEDVEQCLRNCSGAILEAYGKK